MGKRKAMGQRRAEKVLARTRRKRGTGRVCGGTRWDATLRPGDADNCPPSAVERSVPAQRARERDALDDLLEVDVAAAPTSLIRDAVVAAVRRTLAEESATPGELLAGRLREIDDEYAATVDTDEHCRCCDHYLDPDDGPSEWERLRLVRWLMTARERHRGDPALAGEAVAWVATYLDRRGSLIDQRARHLGGPGVPRPETAVEVKRAFADLCAHDDVAVLVWLVSGLVAVAGQGDPAWLDRLVQTRSG